MLIQPIDYFLVVWFLLAAASTVGFLSDQPATRTGRDLELATDCGMSFPRHSSSPVLPGRRTWWQSRRPIRAGSGR